MLKIASKIYDGRINATNVLTEISVEEYLSVAKQVVTKNEFQRKKVKRTSTVYSLLRKDLKMHCTMPPIVLAVAVQGNESIRLENVDEAYINDIFNADRIIILDGLQRTYNLIEALQELENAGDANAYKNFLLLKLRVEFYIGINRISILYRMLTLNTGQTPMSLRHQIEILYSDYLKQSINGIVFYRQVEEMQIKRIGEYYFDDVVSGFNSYLSRDESGIDRLDILDNVSNLEKLAEENNQSDVFTQYISSYNRLALKFENLTNGWSYSDDSDEPCKSFYGKDITHIFAKAQTMSAYGAAIGMLKDNPNVENVNSFDDIDKMICNLSLGDNDYRKVMISFLKTMDNVRASAKKIGVEQRCYLKYFFKFLFISTEESFLNVDKTISLAFSRYNASK
jgi:hypothetical protein